MPRSLCAWDSLEAAARRRGYYSLIHGGRVVLSAAWSCVRHKKVTAVGPGKATRELFRPRLPLHRPRLSLLGARGRRRDWLRCRRRRLRRFCRRRWCVCRRWLCRRGGRRGWRRGWRWWCVCRRGGRRGWCFCRRRAGRRRRGSRWHSRRSRSGWRHARQHSGGRFHRRHRRAGHERLDLDECSVKGSVR